MTAAKITGFFIITILLFAGIYVIAVVTPKLAEYIDKLRSQSKSPYESAPIPERVDNDTNSKESNSNAVANDNKDSSFEQ